MLTMKKMFPATEAPARMDRNCLGSRLALSLSSIVHLLRRNFPLQEKYPRVYDVEVYLWPLILCCAGNSVELRACLYSACMNTCIRCTDTCTDGRGRCA